ncbi:MAG: glycosyl transferase [Chloroflexi bacterium GWB2_49_20]|nr:MAG: glycosyl transferase [Chloroflexi bacterium GWB2_49_20]OGN78167.1 MAG: glycosyl transferase [Chloroflexi bacterium GWC2_49_37]OGN85203.1 MAG: glycosyl transferase [Chloroflexi bacterium GWD2_49_16]
MLRIAMLSYHTCPLATLGGKNTGGMNVYVRDLTQALGRKGIHVDVFTRSQDEHVPHVLHDLGFGNRVVHIPAGPEVPLPKDELVTYIPKFVDEIQSFASEKKLHYDLIHSHYWMSGLAGRTLKAAWDIPMVQMFHTLGEMKNRVAKSPAEKEGKYRIEVENQLLVTADKIVAATLAERAQLEWLYKADVKKIVVIPPGVDVSHFYPIPVDEARAFIGVDPGDQMVLFVGRIEPLKGVDILIQAISCLNFRDITSNGPILLTIIGGDPDVIPADMSVEMAKLQKMCDDLCMGKMVIFLGKRGQDTLPYYYSAADVVVMPSHYESFGMVALEAMACGTPVVASQVGGLAFLVQNGVTGYHVPDDDPSELCMRLKQLLGDRELRKTLGSQANSYAQEYSWEKISDQIVDLYKDVLSK